MIRKYKYIIFADTEFISSKKVKQPIQVSFIAYKIKGNQFIYEKDYSTYISLKEGTYLNQYVKAFTGIDEEILEKHGILSIDARKQLLEFLGEFDTENTLICGWDIANDISMINILLNEEENPCNINCFDWYDVAIPYKHFYENESNNSPSLASACLKLNLEGNIFHDAYGDAYATSRIMQYLSIEKSFGVLMQPIYKSLYKEKKKDRVVA